MSTWTTRSLVCGRIARNNNRGLTDVAEGLVAGTVSIDVVTQIRRPPPPPVRQL